MITHKEIQKIDLAGGYQRLTIRLIAETPEDQVAILKGGEVIENYITTHFNVSAIEDARPPIYILKIQITKPLAG